MSAPRPRRFTRAVGFVVAILLGAAGAIAVASPAMAATDCSDSWHIITHGETGLALEPQVRADGWRPVYADGGPDFWNQQFLFCRDPLWRTNHYAIYSNFTGHYCSTSAGNMQCDSVAIEGLEQLFEIKRYPNSVWWYITDVHGFPDLQRLLYPTPDEIPQYRMVADSYVAPLAGRHLFRITPSNLMA